MKLLKYLKDFHLADLVQRRIGHLLLIALKGVLYFISNSIYVCLVSSQIRVFIVGIYLFYCISFSFKGVTIL